MKKLRRLGEQVYKIGKITTGTGKAFNNKRKVLNYELSNTNHVHRFFTGWLFFSLLLRFTKCSNT